VSLNGTLVEDKMCTFTLEYMHFVFNQCPIYTHDGASAKFSTNSHKTDYSAGCFVQTLSSVCVLLGGGVVCGSNSTYIMCECDTRTTTQMDTLQNLRTFDVVCVYLRTCMTCTLSTVLT
jgi:hypothetical protein